MRIIFVERRWKDETLHYLGKAFERNLAGSFAFSPCTSARPTAIGNIVWVYGFVRPVGTWRPLTKGFRLEEFFIRKALANIDIMHSQFDVFTRDTRFETETRPTTPASRFWWHHPEIAAPALKDSYHCSSQFPEWKRLCRHLKAGLRRAPTLSENNVHRWHSRVWA